MGAGIGMSDIVVYDIGSKISGLLQKPVNILSTVLFPRMARKPSIYQAKRALLLIIGLSVLMVGITNLFMPYIVKFFIAEEIDISAIRLYSLAPIILGGSSFVAVNVFFAFGKDKWLLHSTYVTTIGYLILLAAMYFGGLLTSVMSFVILTVSAYFIEALYRYMLCTRLTTSNPQPL